jgi:hypothetical protein
MFILLTLFKLLQRLKGALAYYFPTRPSQGAGRPAGRLADDEVLGLLLDPRTKESMSYVLSSEPDLLSEGGRARRLLREAVTRFSPIADPGTLPLPPSHHH